VNPAELLDGTGGRARLDSLGRELDRATDQVADLTAELSQGFSKAIAGLLRETEARAEALREERDAERLRLADPVEVAWEQAQGVLLGALETDAQRLRLQGLLRSVISEIRVLIVPQGRDRLCVAQAWFRGSSQCRNFAVYHMPAQGNGAGRTEGSWWARSFVAPAGLEGLDLRRRDHAERLEKALITAGMVE
jgi:hypothetical protein